MAFGLEPLARVAQTIFRLSFVLVLARLQVFFPILCPFLPTVAWNQRVVLAREGLYSSHQENGTSDDICFFLRSFHLSKFFSIRLNCAFAEQEINKDGEE